MVEWLAKVSGDGRSQCLVFDGNQWNHSPYWLQHTYPELRGLNNDQHSQIRSEYRRGVCSIVIYVQGYIISVFSAVAPSR